jgi:hypothetical protein
MMESAQHCPESIWRWYQWWLARRRWDNIHLQNDESQMRRRKKRKVGHTLLVRSVTVTSRPTARGLASEFYSKLGGIRHQSEHREGGASRNREGV